jgi:hypothetical protein
MSDFSQIIDLVDEKLIAIHKNLHGDITDSAVVEAHHLVTTEMTRRGLDHGHVDDEWSIVQVEIDLVQSVDLEDVTTSLSDELAVEVAKTIGISGDIRVVLGINGYEMLIEKSMNEDEDPEFDELAGDVEKTIRRVKGKYTVFSADGSREFGTYDTKSEAEDRLAQIERFKKEDGHTPPKSVRDEAKMALGWIEEGKAGQGFTSVGRTRASQLANGESISIATLKRMRSFFARHIVDKKAEGFGRGEKGYPSPGRVAWAAWGGDAGRAWAESVLDRVLEKEMYEPEDELNERQQVLYGYIEDVVGRYGAFNTGVGADGAHYMSPENNPFAKDGMKCANCVFFEGGGGCEILNQEVQPEGACKFWIIPEKLLSNVDKHYGGGHAQSSHGSWAGGGTDPTSIVNSTVANRIKSNLSQRQIQETYGQNYDEGKRAKQEAPRTGLKSRNNYERRRDQYLSEVAKYPDRSAEAENYSANLAEAQGFMDGFDGHKPIVRISKWSLNEMPFGVGERAGIFKEEGDDDGYTKNEGSSSQEFGIEQQGGSSTELESNDSGRKERLVSGSNSTNNKVEKHGDHDQSSHGNWATSGNKMPKMVGNEKGQSSFEANQLAKNLRDKVGQVEPSLTTTVTNIADGIGAKMEGLQFRLKTEKSLARKIDADSKDFGGDKEKAANKVSDAVRYTMVIDSKNYTEGVTKALDSLRESGYQASRVKNFWQKGDDYQGINAKIKHPSGFEFEMQFHSPESLAMKEKTHTIYEERRASTNPKTQYKLYSRTVRMISKIAVPVGVFAVGEIAMNPLVIGGRQILIKALDLLFKKGLDV